MKVHELAKELGIKSKELLEELADPTIKNHLATLTAEQEERGRGGKPNLSSTVIAQKNTPSSDPRAKFYALPQDKQDWILRDIRCKAQHSEYYDEYKTLVG